MQRTPGAITLRPLAREDLSRLLSWIDGPAMLVQWAGPALFRWPLDLDQLEGYLARSSASRSGSRAFTATLGATAGVVGHVELASFEPADGTAILCRVIVDPSRRGGGLGTAMVRAALDLGFGGWGLRRIELRVYDANPAAVRSYEKAGFTLDRRLPEPQEVGDDRWGVLVMAIGRERWIAGRTTPADGP